MWTPVVANGTSVAVDIKTGRALDESGVERAATVDEVAAAESVAAELAAKGTEAAAGNAARTALTDALNLATLYPAPTPEENAIIDAQVATALADFRDLSNPPADVVALAAAVVSWRATT